MTNPQKSIEAPIKPVLLGRRMVWGAIPATLLVIAFLWGAGSGDPNWSRYWMLRPLLIIPLAGAAGGAVYAFLDGMRIALHWNRSIILIFSFIIYFIGLWLSFVLGFAGTYWH